MEKLDALLEAVQLKALPRSGWRRAGIDRPESVAAHSWGVAWLTLALLPEDLDVKTALAYAVLHDLAEVRVGDLTPHDGVPREEKLRRERAAMVEITEGLGDARLLSTWEDYEAQLDEEGRFVRQLDRLDMALQALSQHEQGASGMAEFIDSADRFIDHERLRPLMDGILERLSRRGPGGA